MDPLMKVCQSGLSPVPHFLDTLPTGTYNSKEGGSLDLDDKFKKLIRELGIAINESLSESDRIAEVIARIRAAGYDLFLVLEVTIGFNKRGETEQVHRQKLSPSRRREKGEFRLTTQDAAFLRELKISVDEEGR
jgi:hypothetical protein